MTYIPDCRSDEYYNQKYLDADDGKFLAGYDWAVDQAINLFDNLEVFPEAEELLEDNDAVIREGKKETMKEALKDWLEMERDELITSMIDNMDEDRYERIKKKVDGSEE